MTSLLYDAKKFHTGDLLVVRQSLDFLYLLVLSAQYCTVGLYCGTFSLASFVLPENSIVTVPVLLLVVRVQIIPNSLTLKLILTKTIFFNYP